MGFLAPLPTFVRICRKKSSEGFHSVPYVMSLFSCMLWIYYATLKGNAYLLITINSVGCLVETIYIVLFMAYASKNTRILTLKLFLLLNFGGIVSILLLTIFLAKGSTRVKIVGWFCVALAVSVFAAPLSIMRMVVRTKSVEFMPFTLSLFLTLGAVTWLFYGALLKDLYIMLPNILGIIFGAAQMVLFVIYKYSKRVAEEQKQQDEEPSTVINSTPNRLSATILSSTGDKNEMGKDQSLHNQA